MRTSIIALLVSIPSALASADAVPPPPDSCPEGSTAVDFCHGPQTCQIATCTNDGECGAGRVCRQRMLCVREHCCSGICCASAGCEPTTYEHVAGACAGGACEELGTTCESRSVCVPGAAIDAGRVDAGRTDAGRTDAGRTDAGRTDAGRNDAGRAQNDAGRGDAGDGGVTDGGCCSAAGAENELGGALFLALVIATVVRFARKKRAP